MKPKITARIERLITVLRLIAVVPLITVLPLIAVLLIPGCGGRGGGDRGGGDRGGGDRGGGSPDSVEDPIRFYVGSSDTTTRAYGIFLCELDAGSGIMTLIDSFPGARGPSYLAFSPEQQYLYAINEEVSDTAPGNMTVTGYRVDREDRGLEIISHRSSQGQGPSHIFCSRDG
ncbi:MAG: lactonase family protein, partial [Bacteroidota bacterium]